MADMLDSALLWYGAHRRPVNVVLCVAIISLLYVSVLKEDAILHSSERQKQQTAPVPRRNILEAPSEIFENLLRKNVSSFSNDEFKFFLSFKENQYNQRRSRINQFCATQDKGFGLLVRDTSLVFDGADGIAYCQIAKVASSTWCNHFIGLGKRQIIDIFS